jgi:hypothetical protein
MAELDEIALLLLELRLEVELVGAETGQVVTPTEVTIVIVFVSPKLTTVEDDVA